MKRVYCEQCGDVEMKLEADREYYVCPVCQSWGYFDEKNPEKFWFELIEMDVNDNYKDIPFGCRACGGDYPNCTSSCNLMSD